MPLSTGQSIGDGKARVPLRPGQSILDGCHSQLASPSGMGGLECPRAPASPLEMALIGMLAVLLMMGRWPTVGWPISKGILSRHPVPLEMGNVTEHAAVALFMLVLTS